MKTLAIAALLGLTLANEESEHFQMSESKIEHAIPTLSLYEFHHRNHTKKNLLFDDEQLFNLERYMNESLQVHKMKETKSMSSFRTSKNDTPLDIEIEIEISAELSTNSYEDEELFRIDKIFAPVIKVIEKGVGNIANKLKVPKLKKPQKPTYDDDEFFKLDELISDGIKVYEDVSRQSKEFEVIVDEAVDMYKEIKKNDESLDVETLFKDAIAIVGGRPFF